MAYPNCPPYPWGLYYKISQIHNVSEIDSFCYKAVTFGYDKYALA
jgi:hypothetical protein